MTGTQPIRSTSSPLKERGAASAVTLGLVVVANLLGGCSAPDSLTAVGRASPRESEPALSAAQTSQQLSPATDVVELRLSGSPRETGTDDELFARAIADAGLSLRARERAALALLAVDSEASWLRVEAILARNDESAAIVARAIERRQALPPGVQRHLTGAVDAPTRTATPVAAVPSAESVTDREIIRELADELVGRTPAPEQVGLALTWLGSPSTALRAAGLAQLDRVAREGGRLTDADLDVIGAGVSDPDALNRSAVVRLLANSSRERDAALLEALLESEASPEVRAELFALPWVHAEANALSLAEAGLAEPLLRDAAASLLLRVLAARESNGEVLTSVEWEELACAAMVAWRSQPTPHLAAVLGRAGVSGNSEAAEEVTAELKRALDAQEGKLRRAAAVALLDLGAVAEVSAREGTDAEIRRAVLDHAARTVTTSEGLRRLAERFRPSATASSADGEAYRLAVRTALDGLAVRAFLQGEASVASVLSASERADVALRRLEELRASDPAGTVGTANQNAETRELAAAIAVRAAECLIQAGRFDEASAALSEDVRMADPAAVDALRTAAGLAQGGGAALPARPPEESPDQLAESLRVGLETLRRLNPDAAAGLGAPKPVG